MILIDITYLCYYQSADIIGKVYEKNVKIHSAVHMGTSRVTAHPLLKTSAL